MIRFIASDLDGTLLDGQGELPRSVFSVISDLHEHGILFAPASGRQYANLRTLFSPVRDKILFICENGALVKKGEKTLFVDPLDPLSAKAALDAVRLEKGLFPILCCTENAYVEDDSEPFFSHARKPYTNCFKTDDLDAVLGREPICKISVYDPEGTKDHAMRVLPSALRGVALIPSGEHWCDIASPSADKGNALRAVSEALGFSRDEGMAFGDHMNDRGMLLACGHPRAVANAVPDILAIAEKIVPANTEGGVLSELKSLLAEGEKSM